MLILVIRRNADDMFKYMNELRELLARTEMCHDKIQHSRDELIVGDVKIRFMTGSCGINTFIGLKPDYYHINGLTFGSILSAELIERGAKRLYTIGDIANTISKHLKEKEKKPMTNFEFCKDDITKLIDEGYGGLAVVDGKPTPCGPTECNNCELNRDDIGCSAAFVKWLYEEHKEKMPTITAAERKFLETLNINNTWIARDGGGNLYVYLNKPCKNKDMCIWNSSLECHMIKRCFFSCVDLDFIKWEDKEPWQVKDLLKLEVK